jgi:ABC-2 type transport system permease protein
MRIGALSAKEAIQIVRDRATLGMLIGVPLLQVLMFGFAIELSPQTLEVAIVAHEPHTLARAARWLSEDRIGVRLRTVESLVAARRLLTEGETQVVVNADSRPITVLVDASDPVLAAQANAAVERLVHRLGDAAEGLDNGAPPIRVEQLFNPGARTQPYLVSGLLGLILTMTLVMMSALSVARERERGTFEGLLALRVRPLELCCGKLAPYFILALVQGSLILVVARLAFGISVHESAPLLAGASALFALANLALGFLFSSLAPAQMPAMQMTFFFFLPSSLLSGFMFPFSAMPEWARIVGQLLPLTHFLRVSRGLIMRGVDSAFVLREMLPIAAFTIVVGSAALWVSRRSLRQGPG